MRHILSFILAVAALIGIPAGAEIIPVWSTGVAVPGEQVYLYLIETQQAGTQQDVFFIKAPPTVKSATMRVQQARAGANPLDPNRGMVEVLPIAIKPDRAGAIQVSDITVDYQSGKKATIPIPPLTVRPTSDIKWFSDPLPYGALWYTNITEGYVDQPVKASLKIFMPGDCDTPYPPQMQAVGVKVGNFRQAVEGIVAQVQSQIMPVTQAYAKGQNWRTADFMGEFTPFREGNSDIAGKILMVRSQGLFSIAQQELPLPVLTAGALPLPPGAPADFANTVGQYSIEARSPATSLSMNEAVEVEITVRGTGNLEQLASPKPEDEVNWKLVPATRKPLVGATGETVGMVFSQLMRPTAEVSGLPSFGFSYFDPEAMEYKTVATKPIPLPWRETDAAGSGQLAPAAEAPPAGTVPIEELTDIYHFIPAEQASPSLDLPRWLWYLLYLPALLVCGWVALQAIRRRIDAGAADRAREKELAAIAATPDGLTFLKAMGAFIESHIPTHDQSPELQQILHRRDEEAFRPDSRPEVTPNERQAMMRQLRKAMGKAGAAALLLLAALMPLSQADDAAKAYDERQYSRALEQLETRLAASPEASDREQAVVLYNIGNCQYRLGQPGQAALSYARALQLDPLFPEARANLQFIQRKEGAILSTANGVHILFTLLDSRQLWLATVVCTAALAFCISLLILRRGQRKPWLQASTALFALLSLLCTLDWVYYATRSTPDAAALPPSDLGYVLTRSTARTAADESAGSAIELTPSTPIHLLARRGSWTYVETFTGVRGWVPSASVSSIGK